MQLNTFACTVEQVHTTGLMIVRCYALGSADVYMTDDFGNLLLVRSLPFALVM